jgi:hypothetical protein
VSSEKNFGYKMETKASQTQLAHRELLYKLFQNRPIPDDQLLICLGLFMRSSALTKILFVDEAYRMILNQPGIIVEFGTWWGQNIILFENLRAIYEPFNQSRRVVGFDTFEGYPAISKKDRPSETIKVGGYNVAANYREYLDSLIDYHEKNNVLAAVKKHELVQGDVCTTAPAYFSENDDIVIALAYFDMALYEPTKAALEAIKPHLIPGSVLMLDEFNNHDYPGETRAFKETFKGVRYRAKKSQFMTDRTFIVIE